MEIIKKIKEFFDKNEIKFNLFDRDDTDMYIYTVNEFNLGKMQIILKNNEKIEIPVVNDFKNGNRYVIKFMNYNDMLSVGYVFSYDDLTVNIICDEKNGEYIKVIVDENEKIISAEDITEIKFI